MCPTHVPYRRNRGKWCFLHYQTGNTILKPGDAVDVGVIKGGYFRNITRKMVLGTPSDDYLKVHHIVEDAVWAAVEVAQTGYGYQIS